MALSAAYRTEQRFGVNHLIDFLRESNSDKIFQFGHQKLPSYGIGKGIDSNQWRSVFRQLVARGYMSVDLERYGALRLEEKCRPLLRGEASIQLRRDIKQKTNQNEKHTAVAQRVFVNHGLPEHQSNRKKISIDPTRPCIDT